MIKRLDELKPGDRFMLGHTTCMVVKEMRCEVVPEFENSTVTVVNLTLAFVHKLDGETLVVTKTFNV